MAWVYFSYAAGFRMHNVHLDQITAELEPQRMLSFIIYLDDQVTPKSPLR